jgi:hypothetical protein
MADKRIQGGQLKRLQILWRQFADRSIAAAVDRDARLEWASKNCGRTVTSFNDLTSREARSLIDVLQGSMGIANSSPDARPDRRRARSMGTAGRRGRKSKEVTIASPDDFARIQQQMSRLNWTQHRLESFLRATSGPLGGRVEIRTEADANKVYWALKGMADRMGRVNG